MQLNDVGASLLATCTSEVASKLSPTEESPPQTTLSTLLTSPCMDKLGRKIPASISTQASHKTIPPMPLHTLHTKQTIRATREDAWLFFSPPRNLAKITPPELGLAIITPDLPQRIYAGLMIEYRVTPMLGIPLTWLTGPNRRGRTFGFGVTQRHHISTRHKVFLTAKNRLMRV